MPAVALKIFKIRAHSDFISKSDACQDILSFRKGQPFYALSVDYEKGFYFVSTQFAVPFSRTAVSGLVPIVYFDKVCSRANSTLTKSCCRLIYFLKILQFIVKRWLLP